MTGSDQQGPGSLLGMSLEADPLLAALDGPRSGPRVVAVGGGTGLGQALEAIGRYAGRIHAVVTVADDGGSSGRLAPELDILPPGDIRKCLVALTPEAADITGLPYRPEHKHTERPLTGLELLDRKAG